MHRPITVLVALYKAAPYLKTKLDNLQQQTYFDQSHIVLLNCQNLSNEDSIYREFAKHKNVTTIQYSNHIKLYASWNDGIKATESDYIINSNVDDVWAPEYLETCSRYLTEDSNTAIVSTQVKITDLPNQIWPSNTNIIGEMPMGYPGSTMGPCPMWRRSLHDKYGYFEDYSVISDALFWEKLHAGDEKFSVINKSLVLYFASPNSLERRLDTNGESLLNIDLKQKYLS